MIGENTENFDPSAPGSRVCFFERRRPLARLLLAISAFVGMVAAWNQINLWPATLVVVITAIMWHFGNALLGGRPTIVTDHGLVVDGISFPLDSIVRIDRNADRSFDVEVAAGWILVLDTRRPRHLLDALAPERGGPTLVRTGRLDPALSADVEQQSLLVHRWALLGKHPPAPAPLPERPFIMLCASHVGKPLGEGDDPLEWGEQLDGFAVITAVGKVVYLDRICVKPARMRYGAYERLVTEACQWASSSGFSEIRSTAYKHTGWEQAVYRRLGFTKIDQSGSEHFPRHLSPSLFPAGQEHRIALHFMLPSTDERQ